MVYKPVGVDESGNFPPRVLGALKNVFPTFGQTAFSLMSKLDAGLESASLVVIGDSTGDETNVQNRWVLRTAQWLAARYPNYTVNFHQWNIGANLTAPGSWDPLGTGQSRVLQTGTGTVNGGGPYVLDVWSASASGSQPAYALDSTRWPAMLGSTVITISPDLVIVNHGHNSGSAPGSQFRVLLLQLTRAIEALWPQASIAVTAQNPTGTAFADHTLDNLRARSVITTASTEGYGLINVFQAFLNNPNYEADWLNPSDHLHPSDAGSVLWAYLVTQQLAASAKTTPRAQQNKATQLWVPASAFTPFTTGMTATATFGLTGDTAGMLAFPSAQASSAVADIALPQHWTTFDVFLAWCVASTTGKTASTVVSWRLLRQQFLPPKSYPVPVTGAGTQPLGSWIDPGVQTRNASNGPAYQTLLSRISQSSALVDRVSAFRIQRSGNNGTDNIAETAYVRGLLFVQAS